MSFVSTMNKGFQMSFPNGWTISVQWGPGNYCQNQSAASMFESAGREFYESRDAEIGVWMTGKSVMEFPMQVQGWLSANEVAAEVAAVAAREPLIW